MWTYNVGDAFKKGQPFSNQRWQKLDNTSWLSYCLLYSYNIKDSINTQYILAHRSITHGLLTQWDHVTRRRNTGLAKSQQAGLTFSISMQSLINGRRWNPPSPPHAQHLSCAWHMVDTQAISSESTKLLSALFLAGVTFQTLTQKDVFRQRFHNHETSSTYCSTWKKCTSVSLMENHGTDALKHVTGCALSKSSQVSTFQGKCKRGSNYLESSGKTSAFFWISFLV